LNKKNDESITELKREMVQIRVDLEALLNILEKYTSVVEKQIDILDKVCGKLDKITSTLYKILGLNEHDKDLKSNIYV